ncbi:MAG: class I SAM-dependent methyltransferase [Hyphomicrobiaceae bacterium]
MATDKRTLAYYDQNAADYAAQPADQEDCDLLKRFVALLPPGSAVLDLGAGSGWATQEFKQAGFDVSAIDGSAGLAAQATARTGVAVQVVRFEDIDFVDAFDGIWAAYSLHHAERGALANILRRLKRALRPGGLVMISVKSGEEEKRDSLDRLYAHYSREALARIITREMGLGVIHAEERSGYGADGVACELVALIAR